MTTPFRIDCPCRQAAISPGPTRSRVAGSCDGLPHQVLFDDTGSGKTFAMAHVIEAVQRPTVVLLPSKTIGARLFGEMKPADAISAAHPSLL